MAAAGRLATGLAEARLVIEVIAQGARSAVLLKLNQPHSQVRQQRAARSACERAPLAEHAYRRSVEDGAGFLVGQVRARKPHHIERRLVAVALETDRPVGTEHQPRRTENVNDAA